MRLICIKKRCTNEQYIRQDKNVEIKRISKRDLSLIRPLWEKLNKLHLDESPHFKEHFRSFTFDKRIEKFLGIPDKDILIEVIKREEDIGGYCISTVTGSSGKSGETVRTGELESLFISPEERGNGFGEVLGKNSITWMKEMNCTTIQVSVAWGHESVFGFYEKIGFYPRLTYLQLKDILQ